MFEFVDNGPGVGPGVGLTISGTAEGLSPGKTYKSLLYGPGSSVEGVNACKGSFGLTGDQMEVANWSVAPDGTGTLGPVTKTGSGYAALNTIGTISVRGGSSGTVVVACGAVGDDDDD